MEKKKHIPFISILYGIGATLVVFGHSRPLHGEWPEVLHAVIDFIYCFHMPLFFLVSGILIRYTTNGKNGASWWKRKILKLGIPYLVLTLLGILPKFLLSQYMNDDMTLSVANILRMIFSPRDNIWGHFWFIPVFLVLNLIGFEYNKLILWIEGKNNKPLYYCISIATGVLCIFLTLFPFKTDWLGIRDICVHLVYVIMGIYICKAFIEKQDYRFAKLLPAIGGVIASVVLYWFFKDNKYIKFIISFLMLYSLLSVAVIISKRKLPYLNYVGGRAFTIFLFSWPAQAVVELVVTVVLKQNWYVTFPVLFITGMVVPCAIYEIYTRLVKRKNVFFDALIGVSR